MVVFMRFCVRFCVRFGVRFCVRFCLRAERRLRGGGGPVRIV